MANFIRCDCCGKSATVHLTQIINGITTKFNLCEKCAHERGILNDEGQPAATIFEHGFFPNLVQPSDDRTVTCDNCGFALSQFERLKRPGCSDCYKVFQPSIGEILRNTQRGLQHTGKTPHAQLFVCNVDPTAQAEAAEEQADPAPTQAKSKKADRLKTLETQLKLAITEERYEDAISLRDEIQQLKQSRGTKSK